MRTAGRIFPSLTNPHRNQIVDLLRGLSLVMVMGSHYGLLNAWVGDPAGHFWGRPVGDIVGGIGYYGVAIFFVISGFLIAGLSLRRYGTLAEIKAGQFWWLRFSRIMPMLGLCAGGMIVLNDCSVPGFGFKNGSELGSALGKLFTFRFNSVIGQNVVPAVWTPLWSLSVEESFYLAFPLVCLLLRGSAAIVGGLLAVIILATGLKGFGLTGAFSTLSFVDLLALGCLIALARPERLAGQLTPRAKLAASAALIVLGLAAIVFSVLYAHPFRPFWAVQLCGAGGGLILIAAQWVRLSPRAGRAALPLSLLGVVSYEAYLIHLPLRESLVSYRLDNPWFALALVIGAAILLHEYFSEPLNRTLRSRLAPVVSAFVPR